ncbi:MAG: acyl-CoA dehydrogenase family protein [Candidatus Thermoplasmatota archaeon]
MTTTSYLPPGPDMQGDWFSDDAALRRFLAKRLSPDAWKALEQRLVALGKDAPRRLDALARTADVRSPRLVENVVQFDPSYHELQKAAREHEAFTYLWLHPGAGRLETLALGYLFAQAEPSYYCPGCMTDGAAFVLDRHASAEIKSEFIPRLVQKSAVGAFEGSMFLTEPQGGSDVGATLTTARQKGDDWFLTGDKWFGSNANAECILALARMPGAPAGTRGLGLFVIDGKDPGIHRKKLKEKLGVRSMATAEIELRDAKARLIAGENAGFKAMAEMVNLSRLYNSVVSVSVARRALREGQRNARWRSAFGKPLAEQPLYVRALAELNNDVRGALLFALDTAQTFDKATKGDRPAYGLMRALTPLAKASMGRLAVDAASQACEMLGGNGYVEEWVTPRLLRDAQVLPIWEGTSNVQALDLLRSAQKDGALDALRGDSLARLGQRDGPLRDAWARLRPTGEAGALRFLTACYHLRAATLLAQDAASDGDATATAHAVAYLARHVTHDEPAFLTLFERVGQALAFE